MLHFSSTQQLGVVGDGDVTAASARRSSDVFKFKNRRPSLRSSPLPPLGRDWSEIGYVRVAFDARHVHFSVFLQRNPTARGIGATPVFNWESGCMYTAGSSDHVISVVGWGKDAAQGQYRIVRKWARQWILPVVSKKRGAQPDDDSAKS